MSGRQWKHKSERKIISLLTIETQIREKFDVWLTIETQIRGKIYISAYNRNTNPREI